MTFLAPPCRALAARGRGSARGRDLKILEFNGGSLQHLHRNLAVVSRTLQDLKATAPLLFLAS